jgi:hypothetical protein
MKGHLKMPGQPWPSKPQKRRKLLSRSCGSRTSAPDFFLPRRRIPRKDLSLIQNIAEHVLPPSPAVGLDDSLHDAICLPDHFFNGRVAVGMKKLHAILEDRNLYCPRTRTISVCRPSSLHSIQCWSGRGWGIEREAKRYRREDNPGLLRKTRHLSYHRTDLSGCSGHQSCVLRWSHKT